MTLPTYTIRTSQTKESKMNGRRITLHLALILLPGIANAAPTQTLYKCSAGGCEIHCDPAKGSWVLNEKASVSILAIKHDNGNVELFIDDGAHGKRTLMVSQKNLLCRISNYSESKMTP